MLEQHWLIIFERNYLLGTYTYQHRLDINIPIPTEALEQSVLEQAKQNILSISDMSTESENHGRESVTLSETLLKRLGDQQCLIAQFNG